MQVSKFLAAACVVAIGFAVSGVQAQTLKAAQPLNIASVGVITS